MLSAESSGIIVMGLLFGLTAGISPGPLLTLVITETITYGKKEGIKVAISPLITDLPIIIVAFLILSRYSRFNIFTGVISLLGGIFLVYLGYECLRTKGLDLNIKKARPHALLKGVIANILNPHPYLFWITVGTPLALKASRVSIATVILYFLSFYLMLVGSKIIIALLIERSRSFLNNNIYVNIIRALGISLVIFAAIFFFDSFKILRDLIR